MVIEGEKSKSKGPSDSLCDVACSGVVLSMVSLWKAACGKAPLGILFYKGIILIHDRRALIT